MSDEIKSADSEGAADNSVEKYFDSLIMDFKPSENSSDNEDNISTEEAKNRSLNSFSKFFDDAAAFGNSFESTIDKIPEEISEKATEETVVFSIKESEETVSDKEIINTPVTDEDGMIVIFDEEAGIDATEADVSAVINSERAADLKNKAEDEKTDTDNANTADSDDNTDAEDFSADANISEVNEAAENPDEAKLSFAQKIFPQKGDSAGEVIRKIIFMASCCIFVGAGIMLASTLIQSEEAVEQLESIKQEVTTTVATTINENGEVVTIPPTSEERIEHISSMMNSFVEVSGNVIGFIELPGCDIYYPVVQGSDNKYYLRHTYDDRTNKAGAIFADYRCTITEDYTSPNIILYGHNQEDGTMFGNLKNYKNNSEFYKANPFVTFNTEYELGDYVIFGYFIANIYEYQDSNGEVFHYQDYIETLKNENTFDWYMRKVAERNQIISPVDVKYGDTLLILSTCSNEYSDSRFVVMARKLREGENTEDFNFSSARLNPNAKQIDWDAIMSSSVESETEETMSESETSVCETSETTETTVETTVPSETTVTTQTSRKSSLSLAPVYVNGTTAPPETEATTEESESESESKTEETTTAYQPARPER